MQKLIGCVNLLLLILVQSCQKEISQEIKKDTAKYDLVSLPGSCVSPIISGTWQRGKKLDQTNTVVIPVNVKEKGDWSYRQSVNGITLSGSGNFADTGLAVINFTATGSPQREEISRFPLPGAPGCFLEISVIPGSSNPPNNGNNNGPFYYKATIGGSYFEVLTKSAPAGPADYWSGSGMGGQDYVNFSADISPLTSPIPPGYTIMEVTKGILFNYFVATNATVKNFFAPGSYPYIRADSINFPNASGISILWGDKEGKLWGSAYGNADQTGSTFKIISAEEYNEPTGLYALKVKMQFNCKLYKEDTGEMKQLTNGEMVGLFARVK